MSLRCEEFKVRDWYGHVLERDAGSKMQGDEATQRLASTESLHPPARGGTKYPEVTVGLPVKS